MNTSLATLVALAISTAAVTAQSSHAELKWQRSQVVVHFNPVRFGKHSLSELPIGGSWRMGMNTASNLSTDLPLVGKDGVAAPGSYRVALQRDGEGSFSLQLVSTQMATAGAQAAFPSTIENADMADKLSLRWLKGHHKAKNPVAEPPRNAAGKTSAPAVDPIDGKHAQRAMLRLRFGDYRLDMPISMVGAKPTKVRGFKASAFEWPATLFATQLEHERRVPVLTLRAKGASKNHPRMFNLLINEEQAAFYPAMVAPTESFGFAGVKGFDADEILRGTIEWSLSDTDTPVLAISGLKVKQRKMTLSVAVGNRVATITVPKPPKK